MKMTEEHPFTGALILKQTLNVSTEDAVAIIGDREIFDDLVNTYNLTPSKGEKGKKGVLWPVERITQLLRLRQAERES